MAHSFSFEFGKFQNDVLGNVQKRPWHALVLICTSLLGLNTTA